MAGGRMEGCRDVIEGGTERNSRVVSASSSFLRLIRSLSVSASRRACWMRACIASGDTSLDRPWSMASTTVVVVGSRRSGDGAMRCGSGREWGGRRGRRAGLRQKSRREWGSQMLLVGVVGEEGELQGGGRWEPTSKTARQGPMPLNEMTVGKVEWGVEALEAWGGAGEYVGGCRLQPDRPKQVATKQPKSWTRPDASFLQSRRDHTTKRWRHGSREGGGRREVEVEAATTAASCGAQWGMVFGWGKGRAGQFWRCKEETREMDASFRPLVLWRCRWCCRCEFAAEGEREKRGSSSSPVADEREPSGFWNYYERGARWDGTGGFNLKGVPGRRRGRTAKGTTAENRPTAYSAAPATTEQGRAMAVLENDGQLSGFCRFSCWKWRWRRT